MRGDSAERQLRLLLLLDEKRELDVGAAAARLGCTVRTVYRDFAVLGRFVPLYQQRQGTRARWRLQDGYRQRLNLSLNFSEMLALTTGGALLSGLSGTLFHDSALTALEKVRAALPPQLLERVQRTQSKLSGTVGPTRGYGQKRELLETLLEAVEQQETVELSYRKLGERRPRTRLVDAYNVHVQADGVYLIGWSHERRAGRIYLLDRLAGVRRTARRFERRADFNPAAYLHGAFGPWDGKPVEVRLRFSKRLAQVAAERVMHPSQTAQQRADGELDLTLKVPLSPQLRAWVRGFGADVRVLAPKGLLGREG